MSSVFDDVLDLTVAGGPVRVYRLGEQGPPVVMLHGAGLDTATGVWRRVGPALAESGYRVFLVDFPRHGHSRPWSGVLDDAFCRRFLHDLLDALQLERPVLMGLSMGGGVAIGFALDHPARVSALVLLGPGGLESKRPMQFLTWGLIRIPGVWRLYLKWNVAHPESVRKAMAGHLVAGADTPDFDAIVADVIREARAKVVHREGTLDDWQIRSYGPFGMRLDLSGQVSGLAVPSLWLRGDRDDLVRAPDVAAAAAAAPRSRLVTIADAGHIITYDQPQAVMRETLDFLRDAGIPPA